MSDNGGPAFPVDTGSSDSAVSGQFGHQTGLKTWQFPGMTLRDYFAARAMAAMIGTAAGPCLGGLDRSEQRTANAAFLMADAMLKARENTHE